MTLYQRLQHFLLTANPYTLASSNGKLMHILRLYHRRDDGCLQLVHEHLRVPHSSRAVKSNTVVFISPIWVVGAVSTVEGDDARTSTPRKELL